MKIKNDLVSIKIGNKNYDFNNLILDEYLNRFIQSQLDKENIGKIKFDKDIRFCLLKFDTPFENLNNDSEIHNQDFDVCLTGGAKREQNISEQQIIIQYDYDSQYIYDYSKGTAVDINLNDYNGKKITAIGFNAWWVNDNNTSGKWPVYAVLDTSNYNIYLQENQDLQITRRDIITTDGLFYSNNQSVVAGPAHLCPMGLPQIIEQPNIYSTDGPFWHTYNDKGYGILYSIGLSSYPDYIDKEFIIGTDVEAVINNNEIEFKGIENYFSTDSPLFCGKSIYALSKLYPIKTNYKYFIFKYKIWQKVHFGTYDDVKEKIVDTGYYYYQAIPISKFGKTNLKIKYERG